MKSYTNQYNFRVDNQIKFINLLKKGQQSINYLAAQTNLSFTAASKIVDQLVSFNVLKRVDIKGEKNKRGRIPTLVKINTSVGLTCAIDLSQQDLVITLNDLLNNVVCKQVISDVLFIEEDTLSQISSAIREMLNSKAAQNRPLVGICIAAPGMIYKNSGEIYASFRIKAANNISLVNYFFNEFGVTTNVYNDVKISCLGEMKEGDIPSDANNFLYIHLGNNVGASIVIDGKIYQGQKGFTGEFSNIKDDEDKNRLFGLQKICLEAEKIDPSLKLSKHEFRIDIELVKQLYEQENPAILKAIDSIAKQNAKQLVAYNDFLDLDYIIFEGPVLLFKEKFKKSLLKYISEYDNVTFNAKIIFSSLNENSSIIGTIYQANYIYFMNRLEEITNKRARGSYNINESFDDYI